MNPGLMLLVGGSLLKAGASSFGGLMSRKLSGYESDIYEYARDYSKALTDVQIEKLNISTERLISQQRAATAASGIRGDVGAPVDIEMETRILWEIDRNLLRNAGSIESLRYDLESTMTKARGFSSQSGYFAQAGGSLLDMGMYLGARKGLFSQEKSTIQPTGLPNIKF